MIRNPASFRDPSGYIIEYSGRIFRTICTSYQTEWEHLTQSGLLTAAQDAGQCLRHTEVSDDLIEELRVGGVLSPQVHAVINVDTIPAISYPYEWSFSQLKDAALLTLDLHLLALQHGCVLKDASAYNVQFLGGKPVFIDLLSFERRKNDEPWQAYGQFCRHFLAPLALMSYGDLRFGLLSRQWIDGVPLDLACSILPWRSRFSPALFLHLYVHNTMCRKHAGDGIASNRKATKLSVQHMVDIAEALKGAVTRLRPPRQETEWGDYYTDTNYSPAGMEAKEACIAALAAAHPGEVALDLGANTGRFSALLASYFHTVLAVDADPLAVERHYRTATHHNILPLVIDLASPSPALGWALHERSSFTARCRANLLLALALCHHMVISAGIPLPQLAAYFAELVHPNGHAIVEFIPQGDSQVQRMLASRDDIFSDYTLDNFLQAFIQVGFTEIARIQVPDSLRTIHVWKNQNRAHT